MRGGTLSVRWLGAASDIAHPDLDGEYSVGWNQPTRLHPEESSLDARNPFTLPEHCLVVDEDATALQPEGVLGKTRLRLSFVERHFVASIEEDSNVVRYAVASFGQFAEALVIRD
jgi:hypothetical protein